MKFFAVILGTFGTGISSQLLNLNYFIIFIGTVGFPVGLTKYISEWEKDGKWNNIFVALKQVIVILLLIGLVSISIALFYSKQLSLLLLDNPEYSILIFLVFCSFPFTALTSVFDSFVKGIKRFGLSVKVSIYLSISSLVFSVVLVLLYDLPGVAYGLLISSISGVIIYYIYLRKDGLLSFSNLVKIKSGKNPAIKSILKIGIASLIVGGLGQITQLTIRSTIIRDIGIDFNGIYQCVYTISNNYFNILFMTVSIYSLPVLSEMKDRNLVNKEINNLLRITLLIIVPILVITFVFRDIIIITLYTKKFLVASDYFIYNFTGDFFKALAWVLGAWLIPAARIKTWASLDIVFNFNYFVGFYILNSYFNLGLFSVVIAYAIAYFIHSLLTLIVLIKCNDFAFERVNIKLLITSMILIAFIFYTSSSNLIYGYILLVPVILVWAKLSIKISELKKVLFYIKEYMNNRNKKQTSG